MFARVVPISVSVLIVTACLAGCATDEGGPLDAESTSEASASIVAEHDGADVVTSNTAASVDAPAAQETERVTATGFWALAARDLDGQPTDLAGYAGRVALVVNVASECGYTPQYKGLQAMYEALEPHGFVVLAFPSNEFGGQEPGAAGEIRSFCTNEYGVTFPLFEKCEVRPGGGQSGIYEYLQAETGEAPTWNFCKYLVGRDGKVLGYFPSKVTPNSPELVKAIESALL